MKLVLKETKGTPPIFHFELFDDEGTVVGRLELRATPTKEESYPAGFESHFYYEIEPTQRGKGYGTQILKLGLLEAKNIGLRRVSIVCTEDTASQKTIQDNGALFLDAKMTPDGKRILKYGVDFS
jgi:predicted acetyltransferase